MDFKVVFKATFLEDLEHIVRLVATDNPAAARKLGESLIESSESLSISAFVRRFPEKREQLLREVFPDVA